MTPTSTNSMLIGLTLMAAISTSSVRPEKTPVAGSGPNADCPAATDGDEIVGVRDLTELLELLSAWGDCP